MLFNSIEFLLFFPLVFFIYWFIVQKNLRLQNLFILLSSYFFYGWWDARFLLLIAFSTFVDYSVGLLIGRQEDQKKRKLLLWLSLLVNLGCLGFFKYFDFFTTEFNTLLSNFGYQASWTTLNIILPVGISFYTFQTLSYTIDVYNRKIRPTTDFISFAAFISFFPQLVAGPIERAVDLLPQFHRKRVFEYEKAIDGVRQIIWGFFKKVVIADSCAFYLNPVFNNHEIYSSTSLAIATVLFAIQIYGDFSGYTDIAIGTAKLLGFDLKQNFSFPYFSRDIAEFWRRWHISLSSWFKDYLYIPLGGSRKGDFFAIRNIFIIFLVSGFWHGANWTFIAWGGLNALYFLPSFIRKQNRKNLDVVAQGNLLPNFQEIRNILGTFFLACLAWVLFRSPTILEAFVFYKHLFAFNFELRGIVNQPTLENIVYFKYLVLWFNIILLFVIEWFNRKTSHGLTFLPKNIFLRYGLYCYFAHEIAQNFFSEETFIYFQF